MADVVEEVVAIPEPAPVPVPVEPPPPIPQPPPPPKKRAVPKEMRGALAYAEKRYGQALKEISASIAKTAALKEEINYLIQNIRALGGVVTQQPNYPNPTYDPNTYIPPSMSMPPIPMAQGGGLGIIPDTPNENMFLESDELTGGKGWR